ncbi:YcaO-like family protein [Hoeflea sp. EC-HK425]|uniref:YcaO-like family protein n=1 Tax=Hoeflea sp. EC-HK425 TaxID=2038388 RepID=UPI00125780C9|nr:YcaO-like family protein [Hoeflea sp. EC-HK425]VVT28228.1 conserved hypothetical protein [Hoeflea sp. EC-HK425]|tara:strand:- start:2143 stop:3315 length:1173 start_codon:yes stop_codon:yes gene_type:complete
MIYSDRVCSAEETLERVAPLLATHGITRLARITGLDRIGIPVWNAIRPNARSIAIHQGKGIRDIDAKVSATMEALERAVAEDPIIRTRETSIAKLNAEGARSEALNGLIGAGQPPLQPLDVLGWVQGYDLASDQDVWVPEDAVRLDRTRPTRFWQSSDGLASGNTEDEAIFHALLERIERDAETLWQLEPVGKRTTTAIDPRSFHDPVIAHLIDRIEAAAFRLQLFDITSDLGVPAFSALLAPIDQRPLRYIDVTNGSGCHPIAVRAAIRAITEAVQSRLTLISGARDDVPPESYGWPAHADAVMELAAYSLPWTGKDLVPADLSVADMLPRLLETMEMGKIGPAIKVRLNAEEGRMAVVKLLVPKLENPKGDRRSAFGARALAKLLVFR